MSHLSNIFCIAQRTSSIFSRILSWVVQAISRGIVQWHAPWLSRVSPKNCPAFTSDQFVLVPVFRIWNPTWFIQHRYSPLQAIIPINQPVNTKLMETLQVANGSLRCCSCMIFMIVICAQTWWSTAVRSWAQRDMWDIWYMYIAIYRLFQMNRKRSTGISTGFQDFCTNSLQTSLKVQTPIIYMGVSKNNGTPKSSICS